MKTCKTFILSLLFFTFLWTIATPDIAQAGYLDHGAGSSLVQGIIATIATVKRFFTKITSIFKGNKNA